MNKVVPVSASPSLSQLSELESCLDSIRRYSVLPLEESLQHLLLGPKNKKKLSKALLPMLEKGWEVFQQLSPQWKNASMWVSAGGLVLNRALPQIPALVKTSIEYPLLSWNLIGNMAIEAEKQGQVFEDHESFEELLFLFQCVENPLYKKIPLKTLKLTTKKKTKLLKSHRPKGLMRNFSTNSLSALVHWGVQKKYKDISSSYYRLKKIKSEMGSKEFEKLIKKM